MARGAPKAVRVAVVAISFVLAFLLSVAPLPYDFQIFRPEWVCLLVLYWVIYTPGTFGVALAWCVGLFLDIVEGGVWGGHAMGLSLIAYVCLASYYRIKNYSFVHQGLWVFILLGVYQVVVHWVQGLAGYPASMIYLLIPTVTSVMAWPAVVWFLSRARHWYHWF